MNKIGRPTYLSNYKESLMVAAAYIEGGNCLPLDSTYILGHLKHVINSIKFWCGNNDIINNFTPQVFPPSRQTCQ